MRNLVHQLHSMNEVTRMALSSQCDVCLFCRPDLEYHDSLETLIVDALEKADSEVLLPNWQAHGGFNDRFAICVGKQAIESYGSRVQKIHSYCRSTGQPMHSEKLLKHTLLAAHVPVRTISHRASRVRFDGTIRQEDFYHPGMAALRDLVKPYFGMIPGGRWTRRVKSALKRNFGRKPM